MWRSRLPELVHRKEERERRRYTQTEIARLVDLRGPTVSAWMNYDSRFTRIDSSVAIKFARWLEVDPNELFEYVEDEQGNPVAVAVG